MGKKKAKELDVTPGSVEGFNPVELISKRPETVVLMLQSAEESVLQTVCEALFKYIDKSPENTLQILNIGALEHLVKLIGHEDKVVKRNATMCIGSTASEVSARRILRKCECIGPLLSLLSPEEEVLCHEFSSLAISYIAEDYTGKAEIFEKQGLPLLIQNLLSTDCDVQRNCVRAVGLMLDDFQSRSAFKELNGVEPLIVLLDSEYPIIQELALSALISCSQDAENRAVLRTIGALSKLVQIICSNEMADLHVSSLKCLAASLEDGESLREIQSTGAFDQLLHFLTTSTNPEVTQFTISVIAAAAKNDENRRVFYEQETETTLVNLLTNESPTVVMSAAKALAILAESSSSRDKIGKLDAIPLIIPLMKSDNDESKEIGSLALANLTNGNTLNAQIAMDKNCPDLLIKLLTEGNSRSQCNAAGCLSNLALNETWRAEISNRGVVGGLASAVYSQDPQVQIFSCQALAAYLIDVDSRLQLLEEKTLPRIIELISSNNEAVRKNALWVLVLCAVDPEVAEEITTCGGLDILQEMNLTSRRTPFSNTALERLLDSNLPAKYAIKGELDSSNIITSMFYDTGNISPRSKFKTLEELSEEPVDQCRPVLLVLPQSSSNKVSKEQRRAGNSRKAQREGRAGSHSPLVNSDQTDQSVTLKIPKDVRKINDENLAGYISAVHAEIPASVPTKQQIQKLALFVSSKMGGPVKKTEITNFSCELHMSKLKTSLESNIIPIGSVTHGVYYHRALLFKVLADQLAIPCTLVRGEYGRAWNEVKFCEVDTTTKQALLPPKVFLVDLMHHPGEMLIVGSPAAVGYQRL